MSESRINRVIRMLYNLGPDELEVVDGIVTGLVTGSQKYGQLDIERDPRDMLNEALEEMRDWSVYMAAEIIRRRRGGQ